MSMAIVPLSEDLGVEKIVGNDISIMIVLRSAATTAQCPICKHLSIRRHSCYARSFRSLPWAGAPVIVRVAVHRWFCDVLDCPQKIFCERLPLVPAYARRTSAFTEQVEKIGWEAGGEGTARIANDIGLPVSADTVLRILRAAQDPTPPKASIIGIDDWAIRKGARYGTIIVDQQRHVVIDLLPDREEETVTTWLKAHPEVQVVTRDRDGAYARAISKGAPQARQIADRWHLLHNLADVVSKVVVRPPPPDRSKGLRQRPMMPPSQRWNHLRLARRLARFIVRSGFVR